MFSTCCQLAEGVFQILPSGRVTDCEIPWRICFEEGLEDLLCLLFRAVVRTSQDGYFEGGGEPGAERFDVCGIQVLADGDKYVISPLCAATLSGRKTSGTDKTQNE